MSTYTRQNNCRFMKNGTIIRSESCNCEHLISVCLRCVFLDETTYKSKTKYGVVICYTAYDRYKMYVNDELGLSHALSKLNQFVYFSTK